MIYREQKHRLCRGKIGALLCAASFLLLLTVAGLLPALLPAAQAETQPADEQQTVGKEQADSPESDNTEGQTNEPKQTEAVKKAEEVEHSEESKTVEESEQQSDDQEQPAESLENETEKTEGPPPEESNVENSSDADVETEKAEEIEVEPPQEEPAQDKDQQDSPKKENEKEKCIIGATATLLEKQTGLKFRARIDTGAKSCSLHVEKVSIENESTKSDIAERMTENIGKVITFEVKNGKGKAHPIKRKIAGYVIIKNSNKKEGVRRYKVPMTFLWKNMEKEVLVTLNNRNHMEYPLLLGRNFLRGDFLVDVELDNNDK